jgi:hypothetical protein
VPVPCNHGARTAAWARAAHPGPHAHCEVRLGLGDLQREVGGRRHPRGYATTITVGIVGPCGPRPAPRGALGSTRRWAGRPRRGGSRRQPAAAAGCARRGRPTCGCWPAPPPPCGGRHPCRLRQRAPGLDLDEVGQQPDAEVRVAVLAFALGLEPAGPQRVVEVALGDNRNREDQPRSSPPERVLVPRHREALERRAARPSDGP